LNNIHKIFFIILLIFWISPIDALAAGFVHAQGQDIVDGEGTVVLKRGMGLGGWLVPEGYMLQFPGYGSPTAIRNKILDVAGVEATARFYQAYEANYVNREDILMLGEWGFDHIRLPFHYNQFSPSPGVWNEKGFAIVDSMINWCREANMLLVLDMHCAPGAQNHGEISDSDGTARLWLETSHQIHAIAIWKEIAMRYADEEQIAGYDLLNEPVLPYGVTAGDFRNLYIRIVNAIRDVDTNHLVFIEGNWYATDFNGLTPPFDSNMSYNFHKYWSVNDQGSIHSYVKMRSDHNVPLWMSESGENSNTWFYNATRLLENNNIGWCWWTHKKFNTITSPLSATMPEVMEVVMDHWRDPVNNLKPSQVYAENALMMMAEALKTENCIPRPGVIPALFDDDYGFFSNPVKQNILPGELWAADYDIGTQGIAYFDNAYETVHWDDYTAWNNGYQYRNDGVDLQYLGNSKIPNIGWIEDDEWLKYTVTFAHDGVFDISLEVSGGANPGEVEVELDGMKIGIISTPSASSSGDWKNGTLRGETILAGTHVVKLKIDKGGFNLRKIIVTTDEVMTSHQFPARFNLGQNYPNPFNYGTSIPVDINRSDGLQLTIFDQLGREIRDFDLSGRLKGLAEISWNGIDSHGNRVPSGVYFYRVHAGDHSQVGKMLCLN